MPPEHQALYAYGNAVMEPWDGPAAVCATDGRWEFLLTAAPLKVTGAVGAPLNPIALK